MRHPRLSNSNSSRLLSVRNIVGFGLASWVGLLFLFYILSNRRALSEARLQLAQQESFIRRLKIDLETTNNRLNEVGIQATQQRQVEIAEQQPKITQTMPERIIPAKTPMPAKPTPSATPLKLIRADSDATTPSLPHTPSPINTIGLWNSTEENAMDAKFVHYPVKEHTDRRASCRKYSKDNPRDLEQDPILVAFQGGSPKSDIPWKCPIRCQHTGMGTGHNENPDGIAATSASTDCASQRSLILSMESSKYYSELNCYNDPRRDRYDIYGTVDLKCSEVPVQYFSWSEYDFQSPLEWPKTAAAPVAAFISNCNAKNNRLAYLQELAQYIPVHSFGRCFHNVPREHNVPKGQAAKQAALRRYKFTISFENAPQKYWMTEKLFAALAAGSIPKIKEFGPSKKSIISVHDFESAKELAEYLHYLDTNDDAWLEYFKWKEEGMSKDFIAMVDLSRLHSRCRYCVQVADQHRRLYGDDVFKQPPDLIREQPSSSRDVEIKIREREQFFFTHIFVPNEPRHGGTLALVQKKAEEYLLNDSHGDEFYGVRDLWSREYVRSDKELWYLLSNGWNEFEVIFIGEPGDAH